MAELADAHGSGPCRSNSVNVRILLSAPNKKYPTGYFLFGNSKDRYPHQIKKIKNIT